MRIRRYRPFSLIILALLFLTGNGASYPAYLALYKYYVAPKAVLSFQHNRGGYHEGLGVSERNNKNHMKLYSSNSFRISEYRPGSHNGDEHITYDVDVASDRVLPITSSAATDKGSLLLSTTANKASGVLSRVRQLFMTMFLPTGYPTSVAPEYLKFQIWNVFQDVSTYLRGILSTQAILEGVGVGRADATPLAATLQWITRDGASMISGLVFTSFMSTNFGINSKTWRLFADFMVDIGITLEMIAPISRKHFLLCICLASVCKAMCGIAAGASNGAINEHWAKKNNLAEVLAKGGAQHTAVSLIGLGLGMWFTKFANASPKRIWTAYTCLTVIHLVANYAAMRVLAFTSINRSRLDVLLQEFLNGDRSEESVVSPAHVAKKESILLALGSLPGRLGTRLTDMTSSAKELQLLQCDIFSKERYVLNTHKKKKIAIALHAEADNLTLLKAFLHARLVMGTATATTAAAAGGSSTPTSLLRDSLEETNRLFPLFLNGLKKRGWDLDRVMLNPEGWVYKSL